MTGIRIGATAAGLAAVVGVCPAMAMMPPLMCEYEDPAGDITGYDWYVPAAGFVTYSGYDRDGGAVQVHVLEECATRRQLVLRTETGQVDAAMDAAAFGMFDEMIWGSDGYTMPEMERRLRDLGGIVEMRTVGYESCACANE